MSDHELLQRVGFGLFGTAWRGVLAIRLQVPTGRIERYADGRDPVPVKLWDDLVGAIADRRAALKALRGEIEAHTVGRT